MPDARPGDAVNPRSRAAHAARGAGGAGVDGGDPADATMRDAVERTYRLLWRPIDMAASSFEPIPILALTSQYNLTFGRRTRRPDHDPACGG
jgi:hypothetical protein